MILAQFCDSNFLATEWCILYCWSIRCLQWLPWHSWCKERSCRIHWETWWISKVINCSIHFTVWFDFFNLILELTVVVILFDSDPELIFLTDGASKGVMQILNTVIRGPSDGVIDNLIWIEQISFSYSLSISLHTSGFNLNSSFF